MLRLSCYRTGLFAVSLGLAIACVAHGSGASISDEVRDAKPAEELSEGLVDVTESKTPLRVYVAYDEFSAFFDGVVVYLYRSDDARRATRDCEGLVCAAS